MATKVKPSRIQVSGTPKAGDVPVYVDQDNFQWGPNGVGDVVGPSSSVDGDVVLFDGTTGKLIKDSGKQLKQSDWGQSNSSEIDYIKNKPTIGNATLTIQKNGTNVNTFTANATSNVTANISVPTKTSDITNDSGFIDKDVNNLTNYTLTTSLASVATSGSYNDLSNKPSIPTKTSDLTNDSGFIDKDVNDLTNYTKTEDLPDFTTYQLKSNMVTSLNSADDTHYPTAKAVKDAISSAGGGDVSGPSSSVDGHLAVFDGTTGKIIKDGGAIPTPTTVVDNLNSTSATSALSANQGNVLKGYVDTINGKIPSEASSSNKLADKNYVDDSINQVAAYYITRTAAGDAFATKAQLLATTTFYSGGEVRTPTRNDYCIVLADETHNGETTRYSYQGSSWEYQYTVNETALTQQQVDALNSGITSTKVGQYDTAVSTIAGYGNIVTHNTSEFATSAQGSKADSALQSGANITLLNNNAGYITGVNWGDIEGTLSNQVDLQNALNAKQASLSTTQLNAVNSGITSGKVSTYDGYATSKQNTLVSGTNIKTVNSTSILGSGNIAVQPTLVSGTNIKTVKGTSLLGSGNIAINEVPSSGTTGYVLTKTSNGYGWAAPSGGSTTITVTLTSAGWSSNSQTVSATGVTASNTVIVSPAPSDIGDYADCGVYCSAQGSGTLTFGCDTAPSGDIVVNVLIMS